MTKQDAIYRTLRESANNKYLNGIQKFKDDTGLTHHLLSNGAICIDSMDPLVKDIPESLKHVYRTESRKNLESMTRLVAQIANKASDSLFLPPAKWFEQACIAAKREKNMMCAVKIDTRYYNCEYVARALRLCGSGACVVSSYHRPAIIVYSKDFSVTVAIMAINPAFVHGNYEIVQYDGKDVIIA